MINLLTTSNLAVLQRLAALCEKRFSFYTFTLRDREDIGADQLTLTAEYTGKKRQTNTETNDAYVALNYFVEGAYAAMTSTR